MGWRRSVLGKRDSPVGDAYRSLADLLLANPSATSGYRVPNGTLSFLTQGVTVSYGSQPVDLAAGAGAGYSPGGGLGFQSDIESAWDLAEIWVRNTTPGSIGTLVLNGPVFIDDRVR